MNFKSKRTWFNLLSALVALLGLTELRPLVPAEAWPYLLLASNAVTIILGVFFPGGAPKE